MQVDYIQNHCKDANRCEFVPGDATKIFASIASSSQVEKFQLEQEIHMRH